MTDDIRMLVVSPAPELASRVNSALRGAGLIAQVEWSRDDKDAVGLLESPAYDLVFCDLPKVAPQKVVAAASQHEPPLPVIGLADEISDELMDSGLKAGLRDLVVSSRATQLAMVTRRELGALAAQRALTSATENAAAASRERETMFAQSGDALGRVDDGILIEANGAWRELFGEDNAQHGTPLMDLFDRDSRTKLKAALRKGSAESMELVAVGSDGMLLPVGVSVRIVHAVAGDLIEIAIRSGRGQRTLAEELERAQRLDAETGLLNRNAFLEELPQHPEDTLILVRIDQFARVVEQMGVIGSDSVAVQFAKLMHGRATGGAVAGRLEGSMFSLLMRAGRDGAIAWCDGLRDALGKTAFEHGGRSTPLTASFGICLPDTGEPLQRLDHALAAVRAARTGGGNRVEVFTVAQPVAEAEPAIPDAEWAKRIKHALMKGQFRLAFQPVASLHGETSEAHDSLLRLMDPEQGEVLPGEFLPAAQRSGLMTVIDRWVINEALKTLADPAHRRKGTLLFVRLSDDSLKDATLLKWLEPRINTAKPAKRHLVVEFSAQQAEKWLKESRALAEALKALGCGILLGRAGASAASAQLLQHLPLDYVKFDVSVFDGLARDQARQEAVKEMLEQARERKILAIAPGIEDANTMALLWQLGVDFVQGNYLQEAEVVIGDS